MPYNALITETALAGIEIIEKPLHGRNRGFYADNVILLDKRIPTMAERACVIAEELGHYHTSVGNILDQSILANRKQERRAREWAYHRLIPLSRIVDAHKAQIKDKHNLVEYLGVTEDFLQATIDRYIEKYGLFVIVDDAYTIFFEPLAVAERFI